MLLLHTPTIGKISLKAKVVILSSIMAVLFAVTFIPSVAAYSGQIICLTPTSCANNQEINLTGAGSTGSATFELTTNAPSGTTFHYFVCPQAQNNCASASGTSNGWSWSFTPTTGTTGSGGVCVATSCEGNGVGTPGTMTLSLTAPTTVTSTNSVIDLTIYACTSTGTQTQCNSLFAEVASLSVTATVPEFGLGMGLALAIGMFGLLIFVRRRSFSVPTVSSL